ncbi:MAG: ANTAR domain-containing protein [Bacillota bacterium]|nr:ANTAR domain-containing protein [Bacillota bacterium]
MDTLEYCVGIPDPVNRKAAISALSLSGLHYVGEGKDCPHLLRVLRKVQPHLVIIDLSLPGDVLYTASIIDEEAMAAVLLLEQRKGIRTAGGRNNSFMVLSLPVNTVVLNYCVETLLVEFNRRKRLHQELRSLKDKMQSRILVERAKGIIMQELSLNEPEAYRFLQKKSMDLRLPLIEAAKAILNNDNKMFYKE